MIMELWFVLMRGIKLMKNSFLFGLKNINKFLKMIKMLKNSLKNKEINLKIIFQIMYLANLKLNQVKVDLIQLLITI